jgi:hypothetical protein
MGVDAMAERDQILARAAEALARAGFRVHGGSLARPAD